jgi:alpha-L-arabinofuranosidase
LLFDFRLVIFPFALGLLTFSSTPARSNAMSTRRRFLKGCGAALGATLVPRSAEASPNGEAIVVDPKPLFDISPYLSMQFMEPLGVTDSSVEAGWDYDRDDWREDLISTVQDLAPDVVRFGGLFCRYYKWREGVGPVERRPWMRNYVWGGKETNRVGTHEFVDFCRRVGAEPLYCVNFLSDGRKQYRKMPEGDRTGDAREAADWVSYANDPDNAERRGHGAREPYNIRLWQLGNETSYGDDGFHLEETIEHTIEFSRAMRERDGSIQLIGWGDYGPGRKLWAGEMARRAGEHLNYIAIHLMGQRPRRKDTVLDGRRYQQAPEQAWEELLELSNNVETRVREVEEVLDREKSPLGIAVTEGHLSLRPHNANPLLREWLSAAYHARSMNIYQRHGARVKIATAADFCGTRWTVNAVMIQVPRGVSYLMPVASVMRLFKRHNGRQGVAVKSAPSDLDIAASRSGNQVYLHVANLSYSRSVEATLAVAGMTVTGGRVFEIAPDSLREYVHQDQPNVFAPREHALAAGPSFKWRFPAGSVSAVVLGLAG